MQWKIEQLAISASRFGPMPNPLPHHPIIQHQLRHHHRLAGIAQVLPLGADEAEGYLEAVGQTGQHDGVDDA